MNTGADDAHVAAVEVTISSVTPAATVSGSGRGVCGAGDYLLSNTSMPVGRTLRPGESVPFAGAVIAFDNTSSNQDVCQRATVHLLYTARG